MIAGVGKPESSVGEQELGEVVEFGRADLILETNEVDTGIRDGGEPGEIEGATPRLPGFIGGEVSEDARGSLWSEC